MNDEFEKGLVALRLERNKTMSDQGRKPRRKVPKPGCYPHGFSSFGMTKNQCSLSLHDIRDDISTLSSAILPQYASVYFEEVSTSAGNLESECLHQTEKKVKTINPPKPHLGSGRCVRRKVARSEYLPPRNAAEEKRQLLAVLRRSMDDSEVQSEEKMTETKQMDRNTSFDLRKNWVGIGKNLLMKHSPLESPIPV
jgi:hypothetical protein